MHEKYVGIAVYKFSTRQKHFLLPDFDGGHFENGPKQVVHPNFFLMASTFDIRGGPMNNKNLVSDCPGGGGGVHGNPIWPMD